MIKRLTFILGALATVVLSVLLTRIQSSRAAIPIIFLRAGTNAVVIPPDPTNEVGEFYTNMFIEAEDHNYTDGGGSGFFLPSKIGTNFNATETHAGLGTIEGIEFECWDVALENDYRPDNGLYVNLHNDSHQPNGVAFNDYRVRRFNVDGPDWFDFTRVFSNSFYRIYARIAAGTNAGAYTNIGITLYEVDGGDEHLSRGSQALTVIGEISTNANTANSFFYAPFKTNGVAMEVEYGLSLSNTLSVQMTNGICDFHRLMLVRWTGTPMGFANAEEDPDVIFTNENGDPFYDPEIL